KSFRPGLTADQYRSLLINTASASNSGIQESGAGKLDVQAAISATFAANPTALSFLIGGADPNLSKNLTISNVGSATETYMLAVTAGFGDQQAPALGGNTLTIQPGQSATVPVTFAGTGLAPGQYEGYITIRGSQ